MRRITASLLLLALVSFPCTRPISAADIQEPQLSSETMRQFGKVSRAVRDLDGFLKAIQFERSAILGVNYFAVSVGGIDAIRDLEEDRGVDPETMAGLLAGFAIPEVAEHLNMVKSLDGSGNVQLQIDAADGRLRYKGSVVRLYSPKRLAELFDRRESFRITNERARREAISRYVATRRRDLGDLDQNTERSEVVELGKRFEDIEPLLNDLVTSLESENSARSIIEGTSQHFFGLSIAGINAEANLIDGSAVDPETLGAIYARRVSGDYASTIEVRNGRITYNGSEIRMYSVDNLIDCFKLREKLLIKTGG